MHGFHGQDAAPRARDRTAAGKQPGWQLPAHLELQRNVAHCVLVLLPPELGVRQRQAGHGHFAGVEAKGGDNVGVRQLLHDVGFEQRAAAAVLQAVQQAAPMLRHLRASGVRWVYDLRRAAVHGIARPLHDTRAAPRRRDDMHRI